MPPARPLAPLLPAALLLVTACAPERAHAATFPVNTTADLVDAAPGNGVCAAAGGGCSLRAAVQEANAFAGADVVTLPAGVFAFTRAGAGEDASATGDLDVTETVSITGQGAGLTVVDARGLDRVLQVAYSFSSPADLTLEDLTLAGGTVAGAQGGGVYFASPGVAHLTRVELRDNHAEGPLGSDAVGGGVCSNGLGTLYVTQSRIVHGSADRGGAIFSNGTLYVEDSTIGGNTARAGSALTVYGTGAVYRSTLRGNHATVNNLVGAYGDELTIEDSTLSGNADADAPLVVAGGGTVALRNATIAGNPAYAAIAVYPTASLTLVNTIVWNPGVFGECLNYGGTLSSLGHNVDSDGSCATTGADFPSQDPLLGGLAWNGGFTATRRPRPGSPAIDAGDPGPCTATDQRGVPRPQDGDGAGGAACDIGAVEVPEPAGSGLAAAAALAALRARARRRGRSAA